MEIVGVGVIFNDEVAGKNDIAIGRFDG